jgi:SAM-dependent methyltransferase
MTASIECVRATTLLQRSYTAITRATSRNGSPTQSEKYNTDGPRPGYRSTRRRTSTASIETRSSRRSAEPVVISALKSSIPKETKLSKRSETPTDDPFSERRPTSHERLTGQPWDASYRHGPAPWDVGQPQPAVVRLASEGGFAGAVLDVGCGTGQNALHVASLGLEVLGVDVAETAVAMAREKAAAHGIKVEFAVADAFQLERLGRTFRTVLDSGLFHTFDGDERPEYAASLASVTEHGGTLYLLCFSDKGSDIGPHPISQEELRAAFNPGSGWNVAAIKPDRVQTRFHEHGAPAWFAIIKRV